MPLVNLNVKTDFISGVVSCGLIDTLPEGVQLLVGNDIWLQAHQFTDESIFEAVVTRAQAAAQAAQLQDGEVSSPDPLHSQDTDLVGQMDDTGEATSRSSLDVTSSIVSNDSFCLDSLFGSTSLANITSHQDFLDLQRSDDTLVNLYKLVPSIKPLTSSSSYYFLDKDVLCHHWVSSKLATECDQVVVPVKLRPQMLDMAHSIPAAGHLGMAKTLARLTQHFFWPSIKKDVKMFCRSCDICQRLGKLGKPTVAPLVSVPVISEPYKCLEIML
jgi:hypothetical protein